MADDQMREIEEQCKVSKHLMELSTPKTVTSEISKHYPSQIQDCKPQKVGKLDKYKIKDVPQWFDNLNKPENETPVIQIGGDQTPGSESGAEYELNVPVLNNELNNISNKSNTSVKNGLSLNLNNASVASDDDGNGDSTDCEEEDNKELDKQ